MTDRHGRDEVNDDPSWIDPVLQAQKAEDRIVHALREQGLIRDRGARRRAGLVRFARPLALAAVILIAFAVGTRMRGGEDVPRAVPRAHDVPTTPPGVGHHNEVIGVAFHMVHPLDHDGPPEEKPSLDEIGAPPRTSSPAFHMSEPLDDGDPEPEAPIYPKTVQLASGS